ncbi:MAG TPA: amidohydrolase [Longimicrobiales bacterium]|nr:amidohydrolase [Longimicrobiales bacterium]
MSRCIAASRRRFVLSVLAGALVTAAAPAAAHAQNSSPLHAHVDAAAARVNDRVVAWRRDIHQNPELGNREFRTAKLVADHLRSLGLEVQTEIAHTGVVGMLRGGRPGPLVALRADMDALPVTEMVDLPFASKVRTEYNGQEVGVMHACGHDNHVAILMGVAEVLAGMKADLPGDVMFIFQPAEEGAPAGEEGGAALMLEEGLFAQEKPAAVFGLHVTPLPVGTIAYRAGGIMAASDTWRMVVRGKQTHGAYPWGGVDPIVTASQIVLGLQTVVSRQSDLTKAPAVVTVGQFTGGLRSNIIPDTVVMVGTIRTLDPEMRTDVHERVRRTAEHIAASQGATVDVDINLGYPVTFNDPELTAWALPTLQRVTGGKAIERPAVLGAEDFSYYAQETPGLFVWLGITPEGQDPATAASNHSPLFFADEAALPVGVRALANLAVDYMSAHGNTTSQEE